MKRRPEGVPPAARSEPTASAYLELPEPVDELPLEELPGLGVLLGDELPEDGLPPLDGDVVDPVPDGLVAELLPDEDGVRGAAVDPLLGGLLELLLFEPELSQATSEAAERKAAAISHLFSIRSSPLWLWLHVLRLTEPRGMMRHCDPNNRTSDAKIPCPIFLTSGTTPVLTRRFCIC
jgi:hypothetical protein